MTAEVAIMNKEAVALAADSAVTLEREQKVMTSANKLFCFSEDIPVGVMFYGRSDYMGVPWETVISMYRSRMAKPKYKHLEDYADDFISFLSTERKLSLKSMQKLEFQKHVNWHYRIIQDRIHKEMFMHIDEHNGIAPSRIEKLVSELISSYHSLLNEADYLPGASEELFLELKGNYRKIIEKEKEDVFEESYDFSPSDADMLADIAALQFLKSPDELPDGPCSGIVIAGFGKDDIFPRLSAYRVSGIAGGYMKRTKTHDVDINLNRTASIMPFAESRVVHSFMTGIDAQYKLEMLGIIGSLVNDYDVLARDVIGSLENDKNKRKLLEQLSLIEEKLESLGEDLDFFEYMNFAGPAIGIVDVMTKNEISEIAESFVNLTTFRRRMSLEVETVGGPIDVAVITKSDGFIWIKQKHYFQPELNPHFIGRFYK